MLLCFRVENHKSLRHEQRLLLTPVYDDARPATADWQATTVAGIFGPNASGKSNLLDALLLMRDTVLRPARDDEPGGGVRRHPFALSAECGAAPSAFVVDLMLSGVRYTYGFSVDDERVLEEWLYGYPKRRRRVLFERDGDEFEFGENSPSRLRQVRDVTGPDSLFLGVAARASHTAVEPVSRWFSEGLVSVEEAGADLPERLRGGRISRAQVAALGDLLSSSGTGVRSVEPGEGPAPEFLFHHGDHTSARPLTWGESSKGTRALAALGHEAQRVIENGGTLLVDGIDADLHPHLSAKVISLFQDERSNPRGAQILFAGHDAALLGHVRGEEVLKRDHVWFTEKDGQGRTSLHPLSDFKPRGDENRARRYLTGRYGSVPDVDDELFRAALGGGARCGAGHGHGGGDS